MSGVGSLTKESFEWLPQKNKPTSDYISLEYGLTESNKKNLVTQRRYCVL